jgi:hypothetical protein
MAGDGEVILHLCQYCFHWPFYSARERGERRREGGGFDKEPRLTYKGRQRERNEMERTGENNSRKSDSVLLTLLHSGKRTDMHSIARERR